MTDDNTLTDSFSVLELASTATEADIKRAYRKLSLKLHPDKVAKDVDPALAAARFHQLNLAYETLMDPAARAKASEKSKHDAEKRARQEKYQGKRKQMADELERDEREANKRKQMERQREREKIDELEQLKEQGMRLKEERRKAAAAAQKPATASDPAPPPQRSAPPTSSAFESTTSSSSTPSPPPLGPLDLTTLLRFPTTHYNYFAGHEPGIDDSASSSTIDVAALLPPADPLATPLAGALADAFGPLTDLRFQLPDPAKASKKKSKRSRSELTAFASFASFDDAWAAVKLGGQLACPGEVLADVWIGWAAVATMAKGSAAPTDGDVDGVPLRVRWHEHHGIDDPRDLRRKAHQPPPPPSPPSRTDASAATDRPTDPGAVPAFRFKSTAMPSFSSFGAGASGKAKVKTAADAGYVIDVDYENATLQRLRDAERKRLEDEILRAENADNHP
ncbi:uncharacterized protein PFL1_06553 [Pseudozyma flocculosa PF-1]|uniref:Related to cell cycle control protein cwf23 n=2 Tax=Pseudozyma flocculosa TaxID=84751 RepID=A0A5C3FAZ4_9BASI|nr:uncharacterized protein PFL1_06553 [Pseudozyma flocculosa PF-1]EPQ25879.1 hypothetical protein PFL1_06553 [Pseudozyma flocculosa PF-1]SPO40621.1 related to cell cycle control protein cwf23 [Pseudozyma flocculosa]